MLAGRGDNPGHVMTNTYPALATIHNDLGAIVLSIEAKTSSAGADSWNASQECCWPPADGAGPDDEGYIAGLVAKVCKAPVGTGDWPCDAKRIYVWGHSAGQAMAYRYACDHPSQIAAVFGMSTFAIRTDVDPACAVGHFNYAHFHGTSDSVAYDNSTGGALAPNTVEFVSVEVDRSAPTRTSTSAQAATQNGCSGTLQTTSTGWLDFDSAVAGSETDLLTWSGCPSDGAVEVWKANGSIHTPTMTAAGEAQMVTWFKAHAKP